MRLSTLLAGAALLGLVSSFPMLGGTAQAEVRAKRSDIMPASQVKAGMKGYGLTVFEGTEPEKFDVEIINVLKNFRPHQDLFLIKTKHPRLDVVKVVAGMSGSPVYIDGKMIGAYAYGWTFGEEPIAGVTPIENMIEDLERPLPALIHGWPLFGSKKAAPRRAAVSNRRDRRASLAPNRFTGDVASYDLETHARQLGERHASRWASPSSPVRPVATPVLVGGLTTGAVGMLEDLLEPMGLEPLQAGGGGGIEPGAPTRYVDGGAIAVQMVRGDMVASGLGTVTRVEGDKLLGFGHPMVNGGVSAMPTAVARVLWFLASKYRSFKIGAPVRPVGALVNDRQASIVVSHSAQAPVIPVSVKIEGAPGAPYTDWNMEISHEKFNAPSLLAVAIGNAIQTTAADQQDVSWNAVSEIDIEGYGTITLEDYGVAIGGTPSPREFIRSNAVRAVGALLNNPWEDLFVTGVRTHVELRYAREMLRLRGAELLEPEVDAGQSARIRLTFVPFSGPTQHQIVSVPIPRHLAGETVTIDIEPGYMIDRVKPAPDSLREMIENFEDPTYPPKTVVLSYSGGSGVAYRGKLATNLPPGALDSIRPQTQSIAPEAFRAEVRHAVALPQFLVGRDRVSVSVRPVLR